MLRLQQTLAECAHTADRSFLSVNRGKCVRHNKAIQRPVDRARWRAVAVALWVAFLVAPAQAQIKAETARMFPKMELAHQPVFSENEPVLLEADNLDYDQNEDVVVATGKVQIAQGETVVVADRLSYDQRNNRVTADGNVSMLEPSGHVYFADSLELENDMKAGVIRNFKARMSDNSSFVAVGAQKVDESVTRLFKAAYTPCNCTTADGQPKMPLWQLVSERAVINEDEQNIRYNNAHMDVYGLPVFYTPYLSHPTPNADNQTGLLIPEYGHSGNLGSVTKIPFYYSIAPDRDVTITPIITSAEGPVLFGEYRQRFNDGSLFFQGSATRPGKRDGVGNPTSGHEVRGHVNTLGKFDLTPDTDVGFDIHRATDDTYLRKYNFDSASLLTSKVYADTFRFAGDRSYAGVEALSFQGLTDQDNRKLIPQVAPLTTVSYQTSPGRYNSRLMFDGNLMALYRDIGPESRRLSGNTRWKLPYISADGQVLEFNAQLRTDVYNVSDVTLASGRNYNGTTGRVIPEVSALWHYPFINQFDQGNVMLEPVVLAAISPNGGNPDKIPNEDSLLPEFTESNLFDTNRFTGYDRVETGSRVSYGVRGQAQLFTDKYIDVLFGQNYHTNIDRNFPFTNDLTSHFSDYVGKVGLTYNPVSLAYRFRLDKNNFSTQRSEVEAAVNYKPIAFSVSYLDLNNDPVLSNKEVIAGNGSVSLTPEWTWTMGGSRDLQIKRMSSLNSGLIFKNECVGVSTVVIKDYTTIQDIQPSLSVWVKLSLKNLE